MNKRKRCVFFITFLMCAAAVGLLSAALGTDYWAVVQPIRDVPKHIVDQAKNVSQDLGTKFSGNINFGLFHGSKVLDYGLGTQGREQEIWATCLGSSGLCGWSAKATVEDRQAEIQDIIDRTKAVPATLNNNNQTVKQEITDHGLFNMALWVCVIVFVALGIVWGLVAAGFALLNAGTRPIETITGPMGLYLWNGLGLFFSLMTIVLYLILHFLFLNKNVLHLDERETYWTSENRAGFGFSFWFLVSGAGCYLINMFLVRLSGTKARPIRYANGMNEKAMDGVMMY